ncbi:WAS/WASL-interacting protein family member 1 [Penaeus vannamei]|uniref:WAS/WASL-interacting protein family member 1 n=1 Tax=Penaeus vannamei TaxID=6689 RepID=UPI000F66C1B9|nr:WAS/WASL-interacting protein family member 1-like [Penaeus vannamei]
MTATDKDTAYSPPPMDTISLNFGDEAGVSQPVTPRTDLALFRVPMNIESSSASTPCRVTTTNLGASFDSAIAPLAPPYPATDEAPPPPPSVFSIAVPPPPTQRQQRQQRPPPQPRRRVSEVPLHPRDRRVDEEEEARRKKTRTTYVLIASFFIALVIFVVVIILYSI